MPAKNRVQAWLEQLRQDSLIKEGKISNPIIPEMVFDALYYFQHLRHRELPDALEVLVVCLVDYFICYQMQKNQKFAVYYNLPKIFTISRGVPLFLNGLALFRVGMHARLHPSKELFFLASVVFSIFISSFAASKTFAWILAVVVMVFS